MFDDDKLYPNSDFLKYFGVSKEKAREIVRKRLEAVRFNEKELNDSLKWGGFIFDMMIRKGEEVEWAEKCDLSDGFNANCFVMYVTTD